MCELEALLRCSGLPVKAEKSAILSSENGAVLLGVRVRHVGEKLIFQPSDRITTAVAKWQRLIGPRALTKKRTLRLRRRSAVCASFNSWPAGPPSRSL